MEQEKIKELNTLALYLVKELMKLNFEGLEKVSFNDHTSEVLKDYHLSAMSAVLITYPDLGLQDETPKIEYFLGSDDMFGYLKTPLRIRIIARKSMLLFQPSFLVSSLR